MTLDVGRWTLDVGQNPMNKLQRKVFFEMKKTQGRVVELGVKPAYCLSHITISGAVHFLNLINLSMGLCSVCYTPAD